MAKYMKIAKKSVKQATQTLRTLSTIWNTVTFHFLGEDRKRLLPTNPIPEAIRMMGGLKPMKPKKTVIPLHKLGAWVHLVETMIAAPTTSLGKKRLLEAMLLSLFLGLRNQEARTLQWDQVDLEAGIVTIHELTAKNRRRHLIPLPSYATNFLQGLADRRNMDNPFVSPSPIVEGDVYQPIKPNWQISKEVGQRLKIEFSLHATRRTFASVANHLRIPFLTLKRLMNHHFQGGVTGGYIIPEFNPSENQEEIEKIARFILDQPDAYVSSLSKQA